MKRFLLFCISSTFLIMGFLFTVSEVGAQAQACQVESGTFRAYPNKTSAWNLWYSQSVENLGVQPFLYLDVTLSEGCVGQNVIVRIKEHDLLTPDDETISQFIQSVAATENTLVFRAGDQDCNNVWDGDVSFDCEYYLLFLHGSNWEQSFSPTTVVSGYASPLNIEYDCYESCDNQDWQVLGIVNNVNTQGYVYGSYIHPQDPAFVNDDGVDLGNNTGIEMGNDTGIDIGNPDIQFTAEDLNCGNVDGEGCIQNPLGPGSNIPIFIENLIAIIIQAGIPLIVLALVYSGLRFVLARGNPEKLVEARKVLLWTLVGASILLGAWTIATIVNNTINVFL